MFPIRAVLVTVAVLVSLTSGSAIVQAQEDVVTLTVTVSTPDGDPVGDATIEATWDDGSSAGVTRSNGMTFIDVPDGEDVTLRVEHADYVRNFRRHVDDASERDVSVTVYPKSAARVVVSDGDGRVPDADVTLRKGGRDAVASSTGGDGVVTSGTIESGTYALHVSKPGYYVTSRSVDVDGETTVQVSIRRGTVTLEVNVTDDHFDPPRAVGGVTIEVPDSGTVTSQPTGIARVSVPVNQWASLEIRKDGYSTGERAVYVSETDATVNVTVRRTPAVFIELLSERVVVGERASLVVTDEYGDPVPGAAVRVDGESVAETDEDGRAVFDVQRTGDHEVAVTAGSLEADPATVAGVGDGDGDAGAGESDDSSTDGETSVESPGFGFVIVGLAAAIVLVALVVHYRRRQ